MNQFSLGNAWSRGVSFFSQHAVNHAIFLIGIGCLVPVVLQLAVPGASTSLMNPSMLGQGGVDAMGAMAGTVVLVNLIVYIVSTGSYFASWRIGFGEGENPAGAIIYGLIVGVVFVVGLVLLVIVLSLVGAAVPVLGMILILAAMVPLIAAIYTVMAVVAAIFAFVALLLLAAFGASIPQFAMMGGGGVVILIFLILAAALLYLSARFSCTGPLMADRKTFNLFGAMSESWRLTSSNQWKILGYLALLGVVLMVLFILVAMILGAGMMSSMQGNGGVPEVGIGTALLGLVVSIPFAYLVVLVPAGIYRELAGTETSAKVFACGHRRRASRHFVGEARRADN